MAVELDQSMISPDYCQGLARYNRWQNKSLYREASRLSDAQRREDKGAFFGSIQRTLCHILTADHIWMNRFADWELPDAHNFKSPDWITDWASLSAARVALDARLVIWADGLQSDDIGGNLVWFSGLQNTENTAPKWQLIAHLFNHQTHHRGQVHAMLTSFGMTPDDSDLGFMPEKENT